MGGFFIPGKRERRKVFEGKRGFGILRLKAPQKVRKKQLFWKDLENFPLLLSSLVLNFHFLQLFILLNYPETRYLRLLA